MKPTPTKPAISAMIVAMVVIAFVTLMVLKHIIRDQPATVEHPSIPKQTGIR